VNGDGYDDILIAGPWYQSGSITWIGRTYLIYGKDVDNWLNITLDKADISFIGEEGGFQSGYALSWIGDLTGEGNDDFLIGAPFGNAGKCYLLSCPLPCQFSVTSDAGSPDIDGKFTLSWQNSYNALNYEIFIQYLSQLNTPTQCLAQNFTDTSYTLSNFKDGNYRFYIMAHNEYGTVSSNSINISVMLVDQNQYGLTSLLLGDPITFWFIIIGSVGLVALIFVIGMYLGNKRGQGLFNKSEKTPKKRESKEIKPINKKNEKSENKKTKNR
jgi:hypothetical protein